MFPVSVSLGGLRAGSGKGQNELVAAGVAVDLAALGQLGQRRTEGGGADTAAFSQRVNRDRFLELGQRLADALDGSGRGIGLRAAGGDDGQGQGRSGRRELERDMILGGSGAVFGGEGQLGTFAAQVEVGVAPAMQFAGTAQGLAGASGVGVFAGMVHQKDGQVELALEFA